MEKLLPAFEKTLEAFCQVADVPLTFFDGEGGISWECLPELKPCGYFEIYKKKNSPCTELLMEGAEISARMGVPYVFSCRAGFQNIALPLIIHGEYQGCFIVGPLAVGKISEEVLSTILTINPLGDDPSTLLKLTVFLKEMKIHAPKSLENISTLLNSAVMSLLSTNVDYSRIHGLHRKLASLDIREHETRGSRGELKEVGQSQLSDPAEKKHFTYNGSSKVIQQAVQAIRTDYMEDISLEQLAKKLFINQSYLSMHFKHEMGITFTDFLNEIRIHAAKRLLLETNLSLLEISINCGFLDQSYFGKVFRKLEGCTPREYRQGKVPKR